MVTYLLTWNPKRWQWTDLPNLTYKVAESGSIIRRWSCGNTWRIEKGDRVFLLRQGVEPRGIVGSGTIVTPTFEAEHWDPEQTKLARYVEVEFDTLIDPETTPVLLREQLDKPPFAGMFWDTQASGTTIPTLIAKKLEQEWISLLSENSAPTAQQYVSAFRAVRNLTKTHFQMLRIHYQASDRTITATEMAQAVGRRHYSFANRQYGGLGRLVGEKLKYNPMQERLGTLVTFEKRYGEWHWLMRAEVARALESLGWVGKTDPSLSENIERLFSQLHYRYDVRRPPDERRRGRFRAGWQEAAEDEKVYTEKTLERLTWQNLGYRLGKLVGQGSPERIEQTYEILSELYKRSTLFPDEVDTATVIREGAKREVTVNAYERSPEARKLCIEHYGTSCFICGFDFGATYGEVAEGFIHVHHLRSLYEIDAEYEVKPKEDLRPVCPNCHAVLHLRKPAFSTEEVKALLTRVNFEGDQDESG